MKKRLIAATALLALATLSGPSAASRPCEKVSADDVDLICYCPPNVPPGGVGCRCVKVADDETGIDVW
jgi:hypothetical protein